MKNKTKKIKIFPIGITVLPKDIVPLHIFEERYKNLVRSCIDKDDIFGMVYRDKNKKIKKYGCIVKISSIENEYSDGRFDIIVEGSKRFKIISSNKHEQVWISNIEIIEEEIKKNDNKLFSKVFDKYLQLLILMGKEEFIQQEISKKNSFELTRNVLLPNNIKQKLIILDSEQERLEFLEKILDRFLISNKTKVNKSYIN
tara:strand:+ start:374 stop:973 length:600 start_codon:yes stop_codon:yes gene_type:complete